MLISTVLPLAVRGRTRDLAGFRTTLTLETGGRFCFVNIASVSTFLLPLYRFNMNNNIEQGYTAEEGSPLSWGAEGLEQ